MAVLVLGAGLIAAAAHLVLGFERGRDHALRQLTGPGVIALQLTEAGTYLILHEGEAFEIDGPGTFRLGIEYANDVQGPPVHLALADAAFTRTGQVLAQSLWVAVVAVIVSSLLAWLTFIRRRRYGRRQAAAA